MYLYGEVWYNDIYIYIYECFRKEDLECKRLKIFSVVLKTIY